MDVDTYREQMQARSEDRLVRDATYSALMSVNVLLQALTTLNLNNDKDRVRQVRNLLVEYHAELVYRPHVD